MPTALPAAEWLRRAAAHLDVAAQIDTGVTGQPRTYAIQRKRSQLLQARNAARAAKRSSARPSAEEIEQAERVLAAVESMWPAA